MGEDSLKQYYCSWLVKEKICWLLHLWHWSVNSMQIPPRFEMCRSPARWLTLVWLPVQVYSISFIQDSGCYTAHLQFLVALHIINNCREPDSCGGALCTLMMEEITAGSLLWTSYQAFPVTTAFLKHIHGVWKFEILVLYLSIFFSFHFILLLNYWCMD